MDCDTAGYKQARYDEIANEMKSMLVKVGWKKDFVEKSTPVLPISGWMGDNLLSKSTNMTWFKASMWLWAKRQSMWTHSTTCWTQCVASPSGQSAHLCECLFLESIKSKVSEMS